MYISSDIRGTHLQNTVTEIAIHLCLLVQAWHVDTSVNKSSGWVGLNSSAHRLVLTIKNLADKLARAKPNGLVLIHGDTWLAVYCTTLLEQTDARAHGQQMLRNDYVTHRDHIGVE